MIVTGVNGFVGQHLTRELAANNILVIGVGREKYSDQGIADLIGEYYCADLAKEWPDISEAPDAIIHLAGLAAVGPSFDNPQDYVSINSAMITHMAEFYKGRAQKPRIIVVSSGAIYDPSQPMPLSEKSVIGFSSPYTVSKVLVENLCSYYRHLGLDCVVVRPFNHIGPGQATGFLVPDLVQQISEAGPEGKIKVGNLATKRDYTDVRDVVRAYRLIATAPDLQHTIYNVCSGKSTSGNDILSLILERMNASNIQVKTDRSRFRPTDAQDIYGDASRIKEDTGWQPKIPLPQTIDDFLKKSI